MVTYYNDHSLIRIRVHPPPDRTQFRGEVADRATELAVEEADDPFIVQKYLNAKQWNVKEASPKKKIY